MKGYLQFPKDPGLGDSQLDSIMSYPGNFKVTLVIASSTCLYCIRTVR